MKRVTLSDVAQASGVSPSTVSFVLNERTDQSISAATRDRVRKAAGELGYSPHGIARALREGSSRIVVVIVRRGLETHYAQSFIRGLDDELRSHDHIALVRHGDPAPGHTLTVLDALMPRAILDVGGNYLSGNELEDPGGGWADGLAAHTAIQIQYLVDRGHTEIAMTFGTDDDEALGGRALADVRLRFARETAQRLGVPPLRELILASPRPAAADAMRAFVSAHPEVTAVAALDDPVALRTLAALGDLEIPVPDRIAVIGFDDTSYGAVVSPALTTVAIDAEGHGRRAARHALGLDASDIVPAPGRVIPRESA